MSLTHHLDLFDEQIENLKREFHIWFVIFAIDVSNILTLKQGWLKVPHMSVYMFWGFKFQGDSESEVIIIKFHLCGY